MYTNTWFLCATNRNAIFECDFNKLIKIPNKHTNRLGQKTPLIKVYKGPRLNASWEHRSVVFWSNDKTVLWSFVSTIQMVRIRLPWRYLCVQLRYNALSALDIFNLNLFRAKFRRYALALWEKEEIYLSISGPKKFFIKTLGLRRGKCTLFYW